MKRHLLFTAGLFLIITGLQAQIVITSADMPAPGDTLRKSNTAFLDGIDYQQSGPDHLWLFDELTVMSQQVDTFVNVGDTPGIYQLFFNNNFLYPDHKATVAKKLGTFTAIPGLALEDSYLFIKNTNEELREVGYGVTLEGVSIPIQLEQIDTIMRFPLEYGNIDSANSFFEISLTGLGYMMMSKFRRNTVDGWGTLVTPYGEFQTLRLKTEIVEYDSLYSDSLGIGMPVIRNYTEYKWLANGYPEPVLQVTEEGFLVTASYIDSVRSVFLGEPERRDLKMNLSVYPNPCKDYVTLSYELEKDADVTISLYSMFGSEIRRVLHKKQERGYYNQVIYLSDYSLPKGIYFVRFVHDSHAFTRRIVVN
jgi:hypothetical protein